MESRYDNEVDLELMELLVDETQYLLGNTWELSLLPEPQAEAVAFLVATIRLCPSSLNVEHIKKIMKFWNLTLADIEATIFDLLHVHEEEITESIEEDLYILHLLFPAKN